MPTVQPLLLLLPCLLFSCASPVPTEEDIINAERYTQARTNEQLARLQQRHSKGEITADEYREKKDLLLNTQTQRANDTVLAQQNMLLKQAAANGEPVPGTPSTLDVGDFTHGPKAMPPMTSTGGVFSLGGGR